MSRGFDINLAIFKAMGLNPDHIRHNSLDGNHSPIIRFDKALGPIVELEWILHRDGKPYVEGDELATEFRRYRLVPIEEADEVD